jgi:hypothetical protein
MAVKRLRCLVTDDTVTAVSTGPDAPPHTPANMTTQDMLVMLGECVRAQDKTVSLMDALVVELRSRRVKLISRQDVLQARTCIARGYPGCDRKTYDRYVSNLQNLLTMPPQVFAEHVSQSESLSITWLPKQQSWYNVGDEVDILWGSKNENLEDWWHGVVVGVRNKCQKGSKPFWVHWVGYKKSSGKIPNPQLVSKHFLRVHDPTSALAGQDAVHTVQFIRKNCMVVETEPAEENDSEATLDADASDDDNAEGGSSEAAKAKELAEAKNRKDAAAAKKLAEAQAKKDAEAKTRKDAAAAAKLAEAHAKKDAQAKARKDAAAAKNLAETSVKKLADANAKTDATEVDADASVIGSDVSRIRPPCNDPIPEFGRSGKPATAKYEQFYWALLAVDSEFCFQTLEGLAAGRTAHEESVIEEGKKILKKRCCALFALYGNAAFEQLYYDAVAALDKYEGKQSPFTSVEVIHHLRTWGFMLSPRMWSKAELLMLMCIIMDKDLNFTPINQKDGKDEVKQNRCINDSVVSESCK